MRTCAILLLLHAVAAAAGAPVRPLTVCEVLKNLDNYEGKPISVVGRFSFRENGRFLSEEVCGEKPAAGENPRPAVFRLHDDGKSGPEVPRILEVDRRVVTQKLDEIRRTTSLRRFRFGSPDYDRWALIYGQVERRPAGRAGKNADQEQLPAQLLIRGDGAIVFLMEE
jgi:hypothetical protein